MTIKSSINKKLDRIQTLANDRAYGVTYVKQCIMRVERAEKELTHAKKCLVEAEAKLINDTDALIKEMGK